MESISKSALAVTKVLMGEPPERLHDGRVACKSAVETVGRCVAHQSQYWRCMKPRGAVDRKALDSLELKADTLDGKLSEHLAESQAKNVR